MVVKKCTFYGSNHKYTSYYERKYNHKAWIVKISKNVSIKILEKQCILTTRNHINVY